MNKKDDKTIRTDQRSLKTSKIIDKKFSRTLEIERDTFVGEIALTQHAFLEILDEKQEQIELGEDDVIIGRVPECDVQLLIDNVSRKHARISFRNEEYQGTGHQHQHVLFRWDCRGAGASVSQYFYE